MQRESCCCPLLPFSWTHIPRIPTARSAYRATTNPLCHPSLVVSLSLSSLIIVPVIFDPCPCHLCSMSLSSLILVPVIAILCPYHRCSLSSPLFVSGLSDQSANRATNILYSPFSSLPFLVLHSVRLALGKEFFEFLF